MNFHCKNGLRNFDIILIYFYIFCCPNKALEVNNKKLFAGYFIYTLFSKTYLAFIFKETISLFIFLKFIFIFV